LINFFQHDINFVKCGTCCGLEILASVDDGNGINIFYIDHIRAVLHNQKLKEQAKNSSGDFINEENGSEYSYWAMNRRGVYQSAETSL
jgi:hypothetical protein